MTSNESELGLRCLLCGGDSRSWMRLQGRDLMRCDACRFAWVPAGVVRNSDGRSIYESDRPIFFEEGNEDYYLDDSAFDNARARLQWVSAFLEPGAALLDVGANFGHFVREATSLYRTVGIEPSCTAVDWARQNLGITLEVGSIYDERPEFTHRFDAVTMFDVIEHLPDPRAVLWQCRQYLKGQGRLFITTPDSGSFVARVLGRHWYHCDLVQHIALFNVDNLTSLMTDAGFVVQSTRTFGRIYRFSYIVRRFQYLSRDSFVWRVARAAALPLGWWPRRRIALNFGDVVGVVAQVRA